MNYKKVLKEDLVKIIEAKEEEIKRLKYFEPRSKVVEIVFKEKRRWFRNQLVANGMYVPKILEGFDFAFRDVVHVRKELEKFAASNDVYDFLRQILDAMENWDCCGTAGEKGNFIDLVEHKED